VAGVSAEGWSGRKTAQDAPDDRRAASVADAPAPRRLEEAGFNYLHSRRQLFYDGWIVFLSPGTAKRARSVNAHFGSTLPLARKLAHCEALYERHGLPPLFRLTPFSQPEALDAALDARGYVAFGRTLVQSSAIDPVLADVAEVPLPQGIELGSPVPEAFVEAVGAMRGASPAQQAAHLERLAQSPLTLVPVVARRDGATVAAGMVSVDDDLAGLFDIVTTPALRRQGIGTAVIATLLVKAWERGARHAFLQVEEGNRTAASLYRRFGFATRYAYHYRARPGATG
jgi:ribosomal protein S18 acetylase RimI-like enzyme